MRRPDRGFPVSSGGDTYPPSRRVSRRVVASFLPGRLGRTRPWKTCSARADLVHVELVDEAPDIPKPASPPRAGLGGPARARPERGEAGERPDGGAPT
jgi:hypothetical protein